MKKLIMILFLTIFFSSLMRCADNATPVDNYDEEDKIDDELVVPQGDYEEVESIQYSARNYGFTIALPDSWEGYIIIKETWEGRSLEESTSGQITETGPKLLIRHPDWSPEAPRQDIPVLIFTMTQWDKVQNEMMSLGAAPVAPSELARNSTYVFALPARYNYEFLAGYREVEQILKENPIKTYDLK